MEVKGVDERFHTPRGSARRSTGSEDERFVSPRESARSVSSSDDNEFATPRESASSASELSARAPSSSRVKSVAEAKWDERPPSEAKARGKAAAGGHSAFPTAVRPALPVGDVAPPAPDNDVFSAARHNRVDSVAYMLDQGVGVNARDEQGNTVLLIACQNGLKRMAKLALRRGANINAQNYRGNTALHFCFEYGYGDSLGVYLISKGADTGVRNHDDCSCFDGIGPRVSARK